MKNRLLVAAVFVLGLSVGVPAQALFFLDFESGVEGALVTNIPGVSFLSFNGYASVYGDSRTNNYNTTSDDLGMSWNGGGYHHNGYMWLWAGNQASAQGVIVDFTNNDGTFLRTGYASNGSFYMDAYLTDGSVVSVTGASTFGGPMQFVQADATAGNSIDYVVLHDTGNYWLIDDMSGDDTGVPDAVPEPATLLLLGPVLMGWVLARSRKRRG